MSIRDVPVIGRALLILLALAAFVSNSAFAQLVEGKNYARITNPQPVETGRKIEVIEFFSYGCPHCAELEPHLDAWVAKLPQDVAFRRVPVMFQQRWTPLAKIYYTLDALGVESKLSPDVVKAIHGQNGALWDDEKFYDWAATKGIDRNKAKEVFTSFAVDGKFVTSSDRVGTHAQLPGAIDELVNKARAERPKG